MPPARPLQRVLVTGGAGFIGSTLVRALLERPGCRVLNYDALTYAGLPESVDGLAEEPRHEFVRGDVACAERLAEAVTAFRPDTLMHLAAESHVDRSIADPEAFVRTNVLGTATALRVWRDHVERASREASTEADGLLFVQVSTDEVYGPIGADHAASPGDVYAPSSPYSASKAAADHLVQAYRRTYGLRSILVCPTNNYGPRQFPEKLIPLATLRALRGEPIPLYGDGAQVRDWLHVDDCAAGLIAIAERGEAGETYHLSAASGGADDEWSNRRMVEAICEAVDALRPAESPTRELITTVEDRPGHDRRYALDSSKTHDQLGWAPRVELAEGVRETVRWIVENPEWVAAAEKRLLTPDS